MAWRFEDEIEIICILTWCTHFHGSIGAYGGIHYRKSIFWIEHDKQVGGKISKGIQGSVFPGSV